MKLDDEDSDVVSLFGAARKFHNGLENGVLELAGRRRGVVLDGLIDSTFY